MRHATLRLSALRYHAPIAVVAQNTRSGHQPRRAASELSRSAVREWAERVMSRDAKVRATAQAALVHDGARSLPLLRRFLSSDNEDLHDETFEIIRRIGPPAIPLLLELLRHRQVDFRQFAADALH